jgi:hypothetical protein
MPAQLLFCDDFAFQEAGFEVGYVRVFIEDSAIMVGFPASTCTPQSIQGPILEQAAKKRSDLW